MFVEGYQNKFGEAINALMSKLSNAINVKGYEMPFCLRLQNRVAEGLKLKLIEGVSELIAEAGQ